MATATTTKSEEDALALDLSVLQALLERHQFSHGRTLYLQRMSMVLRSLQRLEIVTTISSQIGKFQERVEQFSKWIKREQWDVSQKKDELERKQQLQCDWNQIEHCVIHDMAEVLSRIRHAASALFSEVSRGFFLPFCAVALSSLSRIHLLIQRIGRNALAECLTLTNRLSLMFGWRSKLLSTDIVDETLRLFAEDDLNKIRQQSEDQYQLETRDQTLTSLGLSSRKKSKKKSSTTKRPENNNDTTRSVTNDELRSLAAAQQGDLGHSIMFRSSVQMEENIEQDTDKRERHSFLHDECDTNMNLVEDVKVVRRSGKLGLSLREKQKQKAPKKKRKLDKKKDLFDELFES